MSSNERPIKRRNWKMRFLLLFAAIVLLIWSLGRGEVLQVAPGSTLVVEIAGQYVEAANPTLLARVLGDSGKPFISVLSLLNLAERDDRIGTVILHIRDLGIGWGKASELRDSIGRLRAAGRKTIAYLELGSFSVNRAYYVATAAEEIYVVPGAVTPLVGLFAEYLYFGDMWEKFGIEIEASKVGKYKSAVETLAGREMSDASREMSNSLLDSAERRFVSAIATGRGLEPKRVRTIIDEGLMTSRELMARGLIDGIQHLNEIPEAQTNRIEGRDYRGIDPTSVGYEPTVQLALIYGSGTVVTGDAQRSNRGGPVFSAGQVNRALRAAAENPEIQGILLRLDSPGGSPLASELIWNTIGEVRKGGLPVVASVSDVAASGAYYVASAADAIVISPGALTGSIGVFALRPILQGLMDKLGVGVESLQRGRYADFQSSSSGLSAASKDRMQALTLEIYELFVDRVASGRNLERGQVNTLGQGRVWSAEQALEVGLVDELGGMHEAISWILRDLELDEDTDVALISYPETPSVADEIADLLQSGTLPGLRPAVSPPAAVLDLLPLPPGLSALRDWAIDLPFEGPLLVPSVLIEIR